MSLIVEYSGNRPPRDLEIKVGNHESLPLRVCQGQIRSDGRMIYLLWVNYREAEYFGSGKDTVVQSRPLFDQEGVVTVSLSQKGELLGQKQVIVRPLSPEGREALGLLFPKVVRSDPIHKKNVAWPSLFAEEWSLPTRLRPDGMVERAKVTLGTVTQHPDWAEIAPAVLLHRELQSKMQETVQEGLRKYFASLERAKNNGVARDQLPRVDEMAEEYAPEDRKLAELGCRIGQARYTNRFAQAVAEESETQLRRWESGVYGWKPSVTRAKLIADGYQPEPLLPATTRSAVTEAILNEPVATGIPTNTAIGDEETFRKRPADRTGAIVFPAVSHPAGTATSRPAGTRPASASATQPAASGASQPALREGAAGGK